MNISLDPRTKLFMVACVSTIVMVSATSPFLMGIKVIMTMIPIVLLISERRYTSAIRFLVLYALSLVLTSFFLSEQSTGVLKAILTGYCGIVAQFLPAYLTAWYMVRTTKIGEFMSCMQKMHIPDGIAISLAVVMRFFPTIKEEYAYIGDAMKMRGIGFGSGSPIKMIEYRMIPLLFSCVNIGDELSAAAITRGLGSEIKRSSVVELKLTWIDNLLLFVFALSFLLFMGVKLFK